MPDVSSSPSSALGTRVQRTPATETLASRLAATDPSSLFPWGMKSTMFLVSEVAARWTALPVELTVRTLRVSERAKRRTALSMTVWISWSLSLTCESEIVPIHLNPHFHTSFMVSSPRNPFSRKHYCCKWWPPLHPTMPSAAAPKFYCAELVWAGGSSFSVDSVGLLLCLET